MNLTHRASSGLIGERPRRRLAALASLALVLLAGHARAVDDMGQRLRRHPAF